jgi:hypothetical protein
MKKILTLFLFSIFLISCKDEKLEKLEKKSEELKCKTEFMTSLIGSSENTITLGNSLGLKNEYENYMKIQADTSKTCQEIQDAWREYSDLVYKKSSK